MSETFFVTFSVVPEDSAKHLSEIEGAIAHCFVKTESAADAKVKSKYAIGRSGWRIEQMESPPTPVTFENFRDSEFGENGYRDAQKQGISLLMVGWTSNQALHSDEPVSIPNPPEVELSEILDKQREIRKAGQCLHYVQEEYCGEVIEAHSIQKSGALTSIAENGEVYTPSSSYGDIKKNQGLIILRRQNIKSVSTFRGFCKTHDNEIFRPIDDRPLVPTSKQAFLYAYRSLCREVYAKKCAFQNYEYQLGVFDGTTATREMIEGAREGTRRALTQLLRQKKFFDDSHQSERFEDARYVIFASKSEPSIVFSGSLFPQFGFGGEILQDLSIIGNLDFITFSFAQMADGWGIVFSWHKMSDEYCHAMLGTLAWATNRSYKNLEGLLINLILTSCENMAISPTWLESLSVSQRDAVTQAISYGADPLSLPRQDYLATSLEELVDWRIDSVFESEHLPEK